MVCEDENIEENEIIDQDYMFEKRVTVRTVEEKNGKNIDTLKSLRCSFKSSSSNHRKITSVTSVSEANT